MRADARAPIRAVAAMALTAFAFATMAQTAPVVRDGGAGHPLTASGAAVRPRVGLVLGGGGARGGAHLGVLEVLESLHVPIDCIAGTSMGALAGGAYADGYSPAEIEEIVAKTD